jgi:LysM repeat protein
MVPGRTYFDPKNNYFKYIIKRGDTLYNISRTFKIDLATLKGLNYNLNPKTLQIGDQVNIKINENLNYYVVQPGDTIWEISQKDDLSVNDIIAYNRIVNPVDLLPSQVIFLPKIVEKNNNIKVMEFEKKYGVFYVSGIARIFEANVNYALETEAGKVLKEGFTMASIGAPKWGKYEFEVTGIPEKASYIAIFSISARDGSRQDEIRLKL